MLTSLPKLTTRRHCNNIAIERIGMPYRTVIQQAQQNTRRHNNCNHGEIERIWTSHMAVGPQAEQFTIVAGQWTTQKDELIWRNIVWTEFHAEVQILITFPNDQWIRVLICGSNLHCYRATMVADNQDDVEIIDGAMKHHQSKIAVSIQSNNKSKAHLEVVYRVMNRHVKNRPSSTTDMPKSHLR